MEIEMLTEALRSQILDLYYKLKSDFLSANNITDEDIIDDEVDYYSDDEFLDEILDEVLANNQQQYEEEVILKLINYIKSSSYKRIMYLILLNDVFEYIKPKKMRNKELYLYEEDVLEHLERLSINKLIEMLNIDDDFFTDILTLFMEYNTNYNIDEKYRNRKLLELSDNIVYLKKFNIYLFDNIQYEYTKRGK